MDEFFNNKTYLVTGASSGIGRAVSRDLLKSGANILLLARNHNGLLETAAGFDQEKFLPLMCDLSQLNSIESTIRKGFSWKEGIDGVVYCAGIGGRARLRDTSMEYMRSRMDVNCFAFVEVIRSIIRLKKKSDALAVVTISSMAALAHHRYLTAYSASKAALEAAAKAMSTELYKRNVRINIIRPAYVDTPMIEDPLGNVRDMIKEDYQPLGIIDPAEVSKLALFLLNTGAKRINGAVFELNAGAFD